MKTILCIVVLSAAGASVVFFVCGCSSGSSERPEPVAVEKPKPVESKKTLIGPNVYLEVQGDQRRVWVASTVCMREPEYRLEGQLCKKFCKEHEYVLHADVDARNIHAALIAAGATPGSPVQFLPKFVPPSGTPIRVTLQYEQKGKLITEPAGRWIRDAKTGKAFTGDWVFAGSVFGIPDPEDETKRLYLANHGTLICLCNIETAMLDLPLKSTKALEDRSFEAWSERIPPLDTPVNVILEPVLEKK
jgi:hypothetical protein